MTPEEASQEFYRLCFQHETQKVTELIMNGTKFVHYTSAENGLKILQNKTLWLRNALLMNDYSEVHHGRTAFQHLRLSTQLLQQLDSVLCPNHEGVLDEALRMLGSGDVTTQFATYMTAVSEHDPGDGRGLLSMWRAYGGPAAGVAIVFSTAFLESDDTSLECALSPVLYGGPAEFAEEVAAIIRSLAARPDVLSAVPRDEVRETLRNTFRYGMLSIKDPGFAEEREWRILHSPLQQSSPLVTPEVTCIRGIPQLIYKIPLENKPGMNFPELELDSLIYRIIIGPTQYPYPVAQAFEAALAGAGVREPDKRIKISSIPLRQLN